MPHNLVSEICWCGWDLSPRIVMFYVTATSKVVLKPIEASFQSCITVTKVPGGGGG
jgi:hypothetical protein